MRKGLVVRVTAALWAIILAAVVVNQGNAVQNSCIMPTSGTVSGLTLVNNINGCYGSILSLYSGASAPASPSAGMLWLDTSTTPNNVRQYDGGAWTLLWTVDATNHLIVRGLGGGTATVASAATTDIGAVPQPVKQISGTTNITSFGTSAVAGSLHVLTFQNTLTLVRNAVSMILPGTSNITTQAGDTAIATYLGSGNWQVLNYAPISGFAVANPAVPLGTITHGIYGTVPPKYVYGAGQALSRASYPAYTAAVSRVQSVTMTSGNSTLTSVPNTAGLGVGMPLEGSGVPSGATIASVSGSTITMSANATLSGTQTVTAILTGYGAGGDSTTVGVAECRGRAIAGRDDMNGAAAGTLTSAYFNPSVPPTRLGAVGGLQTTSLQPSWLPPHAHAVSGTSAVENQTHTHTTNFQAVSNVSLSGGGSTTVLLALGSAGANTNANYTSGPENTGHTHPIGFSTDNGPGASTPFSIVAPTLIADCIVAVLP